VALYSAIFQSTGTKGQRFDQYPPTRRSPDSAEQLIKGKRQNHQAEQQQVEQQA